MQFSPSSAITSPVRPPQHATARPFADHHAGHAAEANQAQKPTAAVTDRLELSQSNLKDRIENREEMINTHFDEQLALAEATGDTNRVSELESRRSVSLDRHNDNISMAKGRLYNRGEEVMALLDTTKAKMAEYQGSYDRTGSGIDTASLNRHASSLSLIG